MRGDRRILWLAIAHFVCGPVSAGFAHTRLPAAFRLTHMPVVIFYALVLSQACLLGAWAALSAARWPNRLAGLAFGALYLGFLLMSCGDGPGWERWSLGAMPAVASAMMAGVLSAVTARWARLSRLTALPSPAGSDRRFRFSIRDLMLLTLAVALVAAGARSLRGVLGRGVDLITVVAWAVCFVGVSLSAVWTALRPARPALTAAAVIFLSGVVGALFAVSTDPYSWQEYAYFVICQILEATLFLGSLLVVRSCGYRLVRREPGED